MQEEIKPIEEIEKKYPNEHISIHVTEFDWETHTPLKGRVIAHGKKKDVVFKAHGEFKNQYPEEMTYITSTLPMPESVLL